MHDTADCIYYFMYYILCNYILYILYTLYIVFVIYAGTSAFTLVLDTRITKIARITILLHIYSRLHRTVHF